MNDINDLIKDALEYADKIIENPDVPDSKLARTMNRLVGISTRLRYAAAETDDKTQQKKLEGLARSLDNVVASLKYQAKLHLNEKGAP